MITFQKLQDSGHPLCLIRIDRIHFSVLHLKYIEHLKKYTPVKALKMALDG